MVIDQGVAQINGAAGLVPFPNGKKIEAEAAPDYLGMLQQRRFNVRKQPSKPVPVFELNGFAIATAGNLCAIQAKVKQGKTGFLMAAIAALMVPGEECLGVTAGDHHGRMILHFDTEQSPYDHDAGIRAALRRAGLSDTPDNFGSYCLTDLTFTERREAIFAAIAEAHTNGGVYCCILDGIADIVSSPNNEEEAIDMVDRLHRAAIEYDALITCSLHENPTSEMGKTRGHLGSQLERKAEANLRMEKIDGTTVVYTERSRHAHIPKDLGARFAWNDEAGMHMPVGCIRDTKTSARVESLRITLNEVFSEADAGGMRRCDILKGIERVDNLKPGGARDRFDRARVAGLLVQASDLKWRMTQ